MASYGQDPVSEFLHDYGREEGELLDASQLSAPGVFEGEREFIEFADRDYQTDRHFAFEIKPEECALIVVDLQQDFVNPGNPMCVPEAYRQIPRVKTLIEACRAADVPVLYTEHHIGEDCAADFYEYWPPIAAGAIKEGKVDTRLYQGLDPQPGERIINVKHTYDSFAGTDLDYVLRNRGVKTIIVCGTLTNFCCESTARTGYFLNYHVVFGSDVNATDSALAHEATLRTMRRGFGRVMDHKTIIDTLESGDSLYREAVAARNGGAASKETPAGDSPVRPTVTA
jgi:nicotinamidase-related amidase